MRVLFVASLQEWDERDNCDHRQCSYCCRRFRHQGSTGRYVTQTKWNLKFNRIPSDFTQSRTWLTHSQRPHSRTQPAQSHSVTHSQRTQSRTQPVYSHRLYQNEQLAFVLVVDMEDGRGNEYFQTALWILCLCFVFYHSSYGFDTHTNTLISAGLSPFPFNLCDPSHMMLVGRTHKFVSRTGNSLEKKSILQME